MIVDPWKLSFYPFVVSKYFCNSMDAKIPMQNMHNWRSHSGETTVVENMSFCDLISTIGFQVTLRDSIEPDFFGTIAHG